MEKKLTDNQLRFFHKVKTGDTLEGKVIRFTRFGAFLSIGPMNGLLHLSEITYGRIKEAEDFLKLNQKVKVKVIGKDAANQQVKLSLKQMQPHPWESLINHFKEGDTVVGTVTEVKDYGAFLQIRPGLEGLVHLSDIRADKNGKTAHDFFRTEETYQAKITLLDIPKRRMQLSLNE